MKKIPYIVFTVSFILLIISFWAYFFIERPLQTNVIKASVNVSEDLTGFDLNNGALTFGTMPLGGSMVRNVIFSNDYSFPVLVYARAEGEIANFLYFNEISEVEPKSEVKIPVTISIPEYAEKKGYTGEVIFEVRFQKKADK